MVTGQVLTYGHSAKALAGRRGQPPTRIPFLGNLIKYLKRIMSLKDRAGSTATYHGERWKIPDLYDIIMDDLKTLPKVSPQEIGPRRKTPPILCGT